MCSHVYVHACAKSVLLCLSFSAVLKLQEGSLLLESGVRERVRDSKNLDPTAHVTTSCSLSLKITSATELVPASLF